MRQGSHLDRKQGKAAAHFLLIQSRNPAFETASLKLRRVFPHQRTNLDSSSHCAQCYFHGDSRTCRGDSEMCGGRGEGLSSLGGGGGLQPFDGMVTRICSLAFVAFQNTSTPLSIFFPRALRGAGFFKTEFSKRHFQSMNFEFA